MALRPEMTPSLARMVITTHCCNSCCIRNAIGIGQEELSVDTAEVVFYSSMVCIYRDPSPYRIMCN